MHYSAAAGEETVDGILGIPLLEALQTSLSRLVGGHPHQQMVAYQVSRSSSLRFCQSGLGNGRL